MYPHRLGIARFDRLEITCYEIFNDDGKFDHHEYWIDGTSFRYDTLLDKLEREHDTLSRLLFKLGEESFLDSVLKWDPASAQTRETFYNYLARQVGDWEDQPRV